MPASVRSRRSSKSSRSSRRSRRRRTVDFETESVASSNLSGFEHPTQAPVVQVRAKPQMPFNSWRSLPDGKYNFLDGKWVVAPTPRNIFSLGSKYQIMEGRLYQWY